MSENTTLYEPDPDEERDMEIERKMNPPDEPYPEYCQGWERHNPIGRRG